MRVQTLGNLPFDTIKGTAADEQDIPCVKMDIILIRVLSTSLGRHIHYRTLKKLQQALLHTLATHVACNTGIVALSCDLIDFIDEYDTMLRCLHIIVRYLQQS